METTRLLSPDDVIDLPRPRGVSGFELVDGRPLQLRHMAPEHRRIRSHVIRLLGDHLGAQRLSGSVLSDAPFVLGLRRDPNRMRIADLAYVSRYDLDRHREPARAFRCVPELIIEIAQGSGCKPGAGQRMIDFFEAGVRVIWAIDPYNREVLAYNRGNGAHNLRADEMIGAAPVFPRLRMAVADLFPKIH